jgi:signal transduction histidine kinase
MDRYSGMAKEELLRELRMRSAQSENEREQTLHLLQLLNTDAPFEDVTVSILSFFQNLSGCESLGLRLRAGDDFPYFQTTGFALPFLQAENRLCRLEARGEVLRDADGAAVLECMCGNVLSGRTDPRLTCFTAYGSFWTNDSSALLAAQQLDTCSLRNRCNREGYESVALIPLRSRGQVLGLLQLNDRRRGVFSLERIAFWERLADSLAIAVLRGEQEQALRTSGYELKTANELLEQRVSERTAELERAIREQESFSYSVSHDLRAPLRHINSFSAMLMEEFGRELPLQARAYLERISASTLRMAKLIDHLLALSRVSRAAVQPATVDLSRLVRVILGTYRESEPDRRVEWQIEKGVIAVGDQVLIGQLLENLLGNAWKYTSKRPVAQIRFGCAVVSGEPAFWVSDNGVGFDMVYRDRLFNAFERLHGSEFEGIGIGLATARRITQRHGGSIWAEGKVGQGATFYFTLPPCS